MRKVRLVPAILAVNVALVATASTSQAAAAEGDWMQYKFDVAHTGLNPFEMLLDTTTVPTVRQRWSYGFICSTYSPPAVANGFVYVGSYCGDVHALDKSTGRVIWSKQLGGVVNGAAVANGIVYVSAKESARVYAFDAASGDSVWTAQMDGINVVPPTVAGDLVLESALDGKLYAFDTVTGDLRWTATAGDGMASAPAVGDGVAYVGARDRKLHAYDLGTGGELWAGATGDFVDSDPVVAGGVVYVGSQDGNLYAFDAAGCNAPSCPPLWIGPGGSGVPVVADGIVYVGSNAQRRLFAFDATGCGAATCDPLWSTDNLRGPPRSSPSIANGVVYAVDRTGLIHAFDAATGATVWTFDTGFADYPSGGGWVTVSDGVLYAAVVFAYRLYAFGLTGISL